MTFWRTSLCVLPNQSRLRIPEGHPQLGMIKEIIGRLRKTQKEAINALVLCIEASLDDSWRRRVYSGAENQESPRLDIDRKEMHSRPRRIRNANAIIHRAITPSNQTLPAMLPKPSSSLPHAPPVSFPYIPGRTSIQDSL